MKKKAPKTTAYTTTQPVRSIFDERMPEPSPYERGVLARFQDGYRRPAWKKRKRR